MPSLSRHHVRGVTLLTDKSVGGGVTFAFTERTGGVSPSPYASLNLGAACGDDPGNVAENRRRVLAALGAEDLLGSLVNPHQVHGDHVVVVRDSSEQALEAARAEAAAGADAVVCTTADVPVLLCFADCVPVVLVAPGGFAVVHSGWKGTIAAVAGKAARVLAETAGVSTGDLVAFVGPHITADTYEVSDELIGRFHARFGTVVPPEGATRLLDLGGCIRAALEEVGVSAARIVDPDLSTVRENDRFFSYRAEHGRCGRHGALAVLSA